MSEQKPQGKRDHNKTASNMQ